MRKLSIFILVLTFTCRVLFAQVAINNNGDLPNGSAMLDVKSTAKGFLPPRMTLVQRNAITNPAEGLMVFCTDCGYSNTSAVSTYSGGVWRLLTAYCLIKSPTAGTHVAGLNQVVWNWNTAQYATGYRWNTTNSFATATNMGTSTTKTETGLTCNTAYTRYIWAYNVCGDSSNVTVLTQSTLAASLASPTPGTHIATGAQVIWNWNVVTGATGYRWNTENVYATASDLGNVLTKTETGLTCGTAYTRYIWAYSACGVSTAATLTKTTTACFACGTPVTVNHVAGSVAPVTKTVNYGTVAGIAGEPSKCWITSNLGASRQATAKDDATEPSGGWYWQFNRKQGYKFELTVIPAWTVTTIDENFGWQSANDPCALEMGNGWRLPTLTEWNNVNAGGGWVDWNGPWNSALKIHAAGYLSLTDGWLESPGANGAYWSSAQFNNVNGWDLDFISTSCGMYDFYKACGFSVRCIREN